MAQRSLTIRLAFDPTRPLHRQMAEGAIEYARASTAWRLTRESAAADAVLEPLASPSIGAAILLGRRSARVETDLAAAATCVLEHFTERGYRRFFGIELSDAFAHAVRRGLPAGCELSVISLDALSDDLAGHAAVICEDDVSAATAVSIVRPEKFAVLGFGDDVVTCELAPTPLSSLDPNARLIGFRAAQQLDRMIAGRSSAKAILVPPRGITARASTQPLAIADEDVARAVAFIRANAHRPLTMADVLRTGLLHRRSLERGFRKAVGRSPAEELRHARVSIAQHLLVRTDLPLAEVARRAGFVLPQHLTVAFKRVVGETPSAYRDRFGRK